MTPDDKHRPFALVRLAITGVLAGAALGALTNSINGLVSPLYFRNILHWHDVDERLRKRRMTLPYNAPVPRFLLTSHLCPWYTQPHDRGSSFLSVG